MLVYFFVYMYVTGGVTDRTCEHTVRWLKEPRTCDRESVIGFKASDGKNMADTGQFSMIKCFSDVALGEIIKRRCLHHAHVI